MPPQLWNLLQLLSTLFISMGLAAMGMIGLTDSPYLDGGLLVLGAVTAVAAIWRFFRARK